MTTAPHRVTCARCSKSFVVAEGAEIPPHDNEDQQPCSGAPVGSHQALGVGDAVEAWLPPPSGFTEGDGDHTGKKGDGGARDLSRRAATVVAVNGGKVRVREADGTEHSVSSAELGVEQPGWQGGD